MSCDEFVRRFEKNAYSLDKDDASLIKLMKEFNDFIETDSSAIETILCSDKTVRLIKRLGVLMAACRDPYRIDVKAFRWNGFIRLFISLVDWDVLSKKKDLGSTIVKLFQIICSHHPLVKDTLQENGMVTTVVNLLIKEKENNEFIDLDGNFKEHCCHPYVSACLIYEFLRRFFFDEVCEEAFFMFPTLGVDDIKNKKLLQKELAIYQPYLDELSCLCINPIFLSYTPYHFIYFKMIRCCVPLGRTVNSDVMMDYFRLIFSKITSSAFVGFAFVKMFTVNYVTNINYTNDLCKMIRAMMNSYKGELVGSINIDRLQKTSLILLRSLTNPFFSNSTNIIIYHKIVREFNAKNDHKALEYVVRYFKEQCFFFTDFHPEIIKLLYEYLLPNETKYGKNCVNMSYRRLKHLMEIVLNIGDSHTQEFEIDSKGIETYGFMVRYISLFVEYLSMRDVGKESLYIKYEPDLIDHGHLVSPGTLDDDVGFCNWSVLRVLFPSKLPSYIRCKSLIQGLRLLSMMHAVNENIDNLFFFAKRQPLLPDNFFHNNILIGEANRLLDEKAVTAPDWFLNNVELYPFMLPLQYRLKIFEIVLEQEMKTYVSPYQDKPESLSVTISRKNIITDSARNNELMTSNPETRWIFNFDGETGIGDGPTKEFYTEFSKEFQRKELDLWISDSNESPYVKANFGVFPSPCHRLPMSSKCILNAIGRVMAKSLLDNRMMSLKFSKAVYKSLFKPQTNFQNLGLTDLKDVMPSITNFVGNLLNVLRQKSKIEGDESLSSEEQDLAVSKLAFQSCSFEDLCINFTIPGFPTLEMTKGGADIFLNIYNVHAYLKLLTTCILRDGPKEKLKNLRDGFTTFIKPEHLYMFYPSEFEQIFNGDDTEEWTAAFLGENCRFCNRLTPTSTRIEYLFKVLINLTAEERKQFLMFCTSSPRVPVGGLGNLNPRLCIFSCGSNCDIDLYLPSAMTCFNILFLPEFSSPQVLKEKLFLAIRESGNSFQLM